jgi:hypothetical protein
MLLLATTQAACMAPVGVRATYIPRDAASTCQTQCNQMGLQLTAVAVMAGNVGCVCQPDRPDRVSISTGATSAGMATIVMQQQQQQQQQQPGTAAATSTAAAAAVLQPAMRQRRASNWPATSGTDRWQACPGFCPTLRTRGEDENELEALGPRGQAFGSVGRSEAKSTVHWCTRSPLAARE